MATKCKSKKEWIAGAVQRPGVFSAAARKAGMTVSAYARFVLKKGSKASARRKKQAVLAQTFARMAGKRKTASRKKR